MAGIVLRGLTKIYGAQRVVDAIDLDVAEGELVCLLGPSGCGKTTTLRLIAGFAEPDAGTVEADGRVLSSAGRAEPPERRGMSMIFQSYALWPHMTVAENVAYGLRLRKRPAAEIASRVAAILATARIEALRDRYPGELSGGQQQRVALARALVVEPRTLLLDEPLSNLDANLREEMRFEIRRLHDRFRHTTVYVTHDQQEAMTTADRIVVMNTGRIEQAGPPESVFERPETEFVARFLGGTNILAGARGDGFVRAGALAVRHGAGDPGTGAETRVSIRPHEVEVLPGTAPDADRNIFAATVARRTYLGTHRDYLLDLEGGSSIRAAAPLAVDAPPGAHVAVRLPPERCRALPR